MLLTRMNSFSTVFFPLILRLPLSLSYSMPSTATVIVVACRFEEEAPDDSSFTT